MAYSEYKQAYSDAKMANRMLMAFLANLHKLNVLLSMKEACLPNGRDRETELNNTLKRLTLEFEAGFADLYYKIHNNIKKLASWCLSKAAWDEQHLLVAKEFLSFDRFFLLKHFAKGEGELLQIVGVFFQGVLASVMEHRGKGKQADFKAASEKLQQTLTYLTGFKKSFVPPSLFSCSQRQKSTNMDKAIEFMEEFIIDFHAHGCAMDKNFEDIYNDLVKQLGIAQPDADLRLKQIKYEQKTLATLSRHFKQRFESLEEWLKALSDSNNSLISKISDTTGDTMLHLLVEMPLIKDALLPKVKELIPLLQQFSHTANQAKETPLSLLEAHDPYQLKNDLKIYALFQDAIKYERGEGRPKNYVMAAQCYQLAIDAGYTSAQQHLDSLLGLSDITAETLHTIGKMYYKGTGIQQVDYHKAKRCFEDASKKGSVVSDYNLGVMYRKGQGGPENFLKASQYYIRAAEQGYKPMDIQAFHDKLLGEQGFPEQHKKTQAKAFEKALITGCFLSTNDYPNTKDEQKNTLLHRVSQKKYYKYCARLIIFGANKDLRNTSGRVPFHVLSAHEQQKVSTLQNRLLNLRNNMNSPLEEVLAARVNVMGAVTDVTELRAMFKALDQLPEIHPLLALARLAALGLHDLANRTKFSNQAYDSDEDDNEVITDNKTLSFQYDAARDTVENLFHYGPDGQQGRKALGIYTFKNEIYMGGNRNSPALRGTTIHELTHFLAQEVFKNECNPYSIDDETAKGDFQKITDDIYSRRFTLVDRELQQIGQVFSYYNQNLWPSELIVRVPQIIVEHGDSGRQKLEKYVPSLLHFYNNQFLARVEEHTEKLKKRALSGWNERLFQAKEATIFRFEIENNTCGGLR